MRTSVYKSYVYFTQNPNTLILNHDLEKLSGIQGAGGPSAIVRRMRSDCNLLIHVLKTPEGTFYKNVVAEGQTVEKSDIVKAHEAKLTRKIPTTQPVAAIDAIDRAIAATTLATETDRMLNLPAIYVAPVVAEVVATKTRNKRAKRATA